MRIFLVSYWYEPSMPAFGGPIRVWELARALVEMGHEVHAFVPRYEGVRARDGIGVHRIPVAGRGPLRALCYGVGSALALLWWSLRRRPAFVYMRTMANPFPRLVARLRGVPFFVEVNDDIFQAHVRRALPALERRVLAALERANCRGADAVVVEVQEIARKLAARWQVRPERIVCLPGGTDTRRFEPREGATCRAELGLPDGAWAGFVGMLYRYQGLTTLVDAAPAIIARVPDARFLVVGAGETEAELRQLVHARGLADRFHFTGWVPYEQVPAWVGAMDVGVVPLSPDRGDAIPMKAFDYMACARPLVIGARADALEIWSRWPGVRYVDPGDASALAAAVADLLEDSSLRERLGKENRQTVEVEYDWREIAGRIVALAGGSSRVVFFPVYWYEPGLATFTGPVRVREIARALASLGHRVDLFVPAYREVTDVPGVVMHRVPVIGAPILRPLSAYVMTVLAMLAAMIRVRPALIYFRTMANPLPLLLARLCGISFALEVNDDLRQAHARRRRRLHNALVGLVERWNARGADTVVVHVPEVGRDLAARWHVPSERIVTLPGGTDPDLFTPQDPRRCRAALGLAVDARWVGFVGTLYRYQGLATLVAAAPTIVSRFPNARFLVVGSGGAEDELRALVEERGLRGRFRFAGWVPYTEVPRYIGAMEVCVMPLTHDRGAALPLKAFDYMACARPIVVSVPSEARDRWSVCPGAVTVKPGVPDALAEAVCGLLGDEARREHLGAANRHAVEQRYAWREIARRIAELGGRRG